MRKQLFKIASMAALMLALTSNAFAEDAYGGLRLGFYGTVSNGNPNTIGSGNGGTDGAVGALLDFGNGLEAGLGLGFLNYGKTVDGNDDYSRTAWELIPGVSYAIRKGDIASWGAGLNIHLASWSDDNNDDNNVNLAFFPNFFMKAEVVKRFYAGLKTGIFIYMPGEDENTKTSEHTIHLRTELFFAFFL